MKLKFKLIHGKAMTPKDEPGVILYVDDSHAEIVTHNKMKFVQIKCDTPVEFEKFKEFISQYIGSDFISTNRYIYIPCEWLYMECIHETIDDDDEDDDI